MQQGASTSSHESSSRSPAPSRPSRPCPNPDRERASRPRAGPAGPRRLDGLGRGAGLPWVPERRAPWAPSVPERRRAPWAPERGEPGVAERRAPGRRQPEGVRAAPASAVGRGRGRGARARRRGDRSARRRRRGRSVGGPGFVRARRCRRVGGRRHAAGRPLRRAGVALLAASPRLRCPAYRAVSGPAVSGLPYPGLPIVPGCVAAARVGGCRLRGAVSGAPGLLAGAPWPRRQCTGPVGRGRARACRRVRGAGSAGCRSLARASCRVPGLPAAEAGASPGVPRSPGRDVRSTGQRGAMPPGAMCSAALRERRGGAAGAAAAAPSVRTARWGRPRRRTRSPPCRCRPSGAAAGRAPARAARARAG